MNFGKLIGAGQNRAIEGQQALSGTPRTLREHLTDQIAYHRGKIADLEAACAALTPDVEKALDALQKLS